VADQPTLPPPESTLLTDEPTLSKKIKDFPWWFVAIILIAIWAAYIILAKDFLFTTSADLTSDLNTGQITELLREEFAKEDITLQNVATIEVQKNDKKWTITNGLNAYVLKTDGQFIEVSERGRYGDAFDFIKIGLSVTIQTALVSYGFALILGLVTGLGRISNNIILNNISRLYVELVRGIPMLVLIFFIALVGVPIVIDGLNSFGGWMGENGYSAIATPLTSMSNQDIAMNTRAIIALAVTYGAFLAEIFRAGIQSITRGQMEAARSLGMSYAQAMWHIILPQAIRNVLPALGNDFVAMVKDSSLVSVVAVRVNTKVSRLYAGSTFRFREAYVTLSVMYLTMTVLLSMIVQLIERRLRTND